MESQCILVDRWALMCLSLTRTVRSNHASCPTLLQYDRNPEDRGQRKIRISGLRPGFYDFSDSGSSVQKSPLQKS